MKLTRQEHPERIKRYAHLRPVAFWKSGRCGWSCAGVTRPCSLERGHRGPHVAHDLLGRVTAVWDEPTVVPAPPRKRALRGPGRPRSMPMPPLNRSRGIPHLMAGLWVRLRERAPSMEGLLLLALGLGMVLFAVDVALRILGWR